MPQRVFLTGASGYLGSAIGARFVRAGYEVLGLTRSEDRARALEKAGMTPILGGLAAPDEWIGRLKNCDGFVHAALDAEAPADLDQAALEAARTATSDGRVKRMLYTSGCWAHGDSGGETADEKTPLSPYPVSKWRVAHEEVVIDALEHGLDSVILRPGVVYGGSRGILGKFWKEARERRTVTIPGDGAQHWAMVHRDDVAEGYLLAYEHAKSGARYLLTDESHLTVREIGEAIAGVTGATLHTRPAGQVVENLGAYGEALLGDQHLSSAAARRELGWVPRHASFVKEIDGLYGEWQAGQKTTV